jgi:predicted nucleic acid-binding protein
MIVISDTTPLRYLIEIAQIDILPALFGQIIIPQAVFNELHDPKTPQMIKDWFAKRPAWLEVRTLSRPPDISLSSLDYGEREAITLALELNADAVLIDDKDARIAAKTRALAVLPTLAILELAAQKNLLDLPDIFDRLSKTTFRAKPELFEQALERDRQRKQAEESSQEEDH